MTQDRALSVLKTGANIFLTGEPGAGKTYVLNQYTDWLADTGVDVAITASTGIAATHIGGLTIHSWSGIGARDALSAYDLDKIASTKRTVQRISKAKVLVIDEVSMLDGRLLDMINAVCKAVRKSEEAFGGLQIIVVGDFFQLPPVARGGAIARFAFESRAWESAKFLTCYLTEQHRHGDEMLSGLLSAIRNNDVCDDHYTLLGEQQDIGYENIEPTKLYTHNKDVDSINSAQLHLLRTEGKTYKMETKGSRQLVERLVKSCLSPQSLEIKREAMVMCTKNNFEVGYVNGTLGRVIDFDREDGFPIIETSEGKHIKILSESWSLEEDGKVMAEITQVPLRLAWAITVHKSQGMSLDAAEIDLRNTFTYGQGYVALSRVRTLAGMKVLGINNRALTVDPRIVQRDELFKEASEDTEYVFDQMSEEELQEMQKQFVVARGGTFEGGLKGTKKKGMAEKKSTYDVTKELLSTGKSVATIAKKRKMALSTIWGHIEQLVDDGVLERKNIDTLIPSDLVWEDIYPHIAKAYDKHGVERLKPIYEEMQEKYDYDVIRLGRIVYTLERK